MRFTFRVFLFSMYVGFSFRRERVFFIRRIYRTPVKRSSKPRQLFRRRSRVFSMIETAISRCIYTYRGKKKGSSRPLSPLWCFYRDLSAMSATQTRPYAAHRSRRGNGTQLLFPAKNLREWNHSSMHIVKSVWNAARAPYFFFLARSTPRSLAKLFSSSAFNDRSKCK